MASFSPWETTTQQQRNQILREYPNSRVTHQQLEEVKCFLPNQVQFSQPFFRMENEGLLCCPPGKGPENEENKMEVKGPKENWKKVRRKKKDYESERRWRNVIKIIWFTDFISSDDNEMAAAAIPENSRKWNRKAEKIWSGVCIGKTSYPFAHKFEI